MGQQQPIKDIFWVVLKEDYLHVYTPAGEEVVGTFMSRLTDKVDEVPELLLKMVVNIATSEEDMRNKISSFQKEQ